MAPERREDRPGTPPDGGVPQSEFEQLFQNHYARLVRAVSRMHFSVDAEEVVTEAFTALWQHWQRNGSPDDPVPYLWGIVRHQLLDHQRRERRRAEIAMPLDAMETEAPVGAFTDIVEVREKVLEILAMLPPRQREVLILRLEGLTDPEIAAELGLEPGTVSAHMSRARRTVRTLWYV
ncbi:sigma-70 family RNA polymerase sigma factor [Streptomyces europaeiscabiei]|nr:sigma-70 family RNA polymerase sigma factor [Streptomyces europaeiscabiei]